MAMGITICQAISMDKHNKYNKQQQTATFASKQPCHFWEQSHRSHVLHLSDYNHLFLCQQFNNKARWVAHHFLCFWCATNHCDPLTKAVMCMWAILYSGLAKCAKNANVCKNCTLELIHQDPDNLRCIVDYPCWLGQLALVKLVNAHSLVVWYLNRPRVVLVSRA